MRSSLRPVRAIVTGGLLVLALVAVGASLALGAGSGTVAPPPALAFVARADDPADALAVGPVAGRLGAPLLTTFPSALDPEAKAGLRSFGPDVVIVAGGTAAISDTVKSQIAAAVPAAQVRRVAGASRTETARLVAELLNEYNPAFLPVAATATDSDLLDGKDATAFASAPATHDRYARCDPYALIPPVHDQPYSFGQATSPAGHQTLMSGTTLACQVDLPHGARVRELKAGLFDVASDKEIRCTLRRNDIRDPVDQEMAHVASGVAYRNSGVEVFADTTIAHAVVDAVHQTHAVLCHANTSTAVSGVIVRYQLVDVATATP